MFYLNSSKLSALLCLNFLTLNLTFYLRLPNISLMVGDGDDMDANAGVVNCVLAVNLEVTQKGRCKVHVDGILQGGPQLPLVADVDVVTEVAQDEPSRRRLSIVEPG